MASGGLLLGLLTFIIGIGGLYCQAKTYHEILESLKDPEKLIFDISRPLDAPSTENLELGVSTSPIMLYCKRIFADYFGANRTYNGSDQDLDYFQNVLANDPEGLCFLFDRPSVNGTFNLTYSTFSNSVDEFMNDSKMKLDTPFKVIFSYALFQPTNISELAKLITFFKSRWTNVTIGLKWDMSRLDPTALLRTIKLVDLVIMNINIPTNQFILSYTAFKSDLRAILDEQIEFIRTANSHCTIHAKLSFLSDNSNAFHLTEDEYKKYYFYLLQFSVFWINDGEKEGLILKPFNTSSAFQEGLDGVDLGEIVSAHLSWEKKIVRGRSCEMKAMLNHVSTSIKSISIDAYHANDLFKNVNSCVITNGSMCHNDRLESDICNRPTGDAAIPDITLKLDITTPLAGPRNLLIGAATLLLGFPIKQVEFRLSGFSKPTDPNFFSGFTNGVKGGILPSETTFACNVRTLEPFKDFAPNDPNFVQKVYDVCSFMWTQTGAIVWEMDFREEKDVQSLTLRMIEIEQNRKQFLQRFPGKSVMIRVYLPNHIERAGFFYVDQTFSLYCRSEVLEQNKKAEVILNFARIHHIPIDVKPVLDSRSILEWFSLASTVDELDLMKTKYPVFVARNYPDRFLTGKFQTDPCITKTTTIPKDGITMKAKYSGTTLEISSSLKNTTLNSDELETILQFTFHKFALVEIIPDTISDINMVLSILSEEKFVSKLLTQESHQANFYFRLDYGSLNFDKTQLSQVMANVGKLILKPIGLHLSNWENIENFDESYIDNLKASGIMVGISLETCVDEVNANFGNLSRLEWINQVDYLVCNIKHPQETTNINKLEMEKYLDTNLYITRYFQRLFPNTSKEILFRLNTIPAGSDIVGDDESRKVMEFFKFYSDVSQFATAHQMKFFMLPTFDHVSVAGRKSGWWKISNSKDLTNSSVFIDKETEYLGGESWRPPPDPLRDEIWTLSKIAFIVLGVVIAVLMGSVLCLRARYRRRFALLSKMEVDHFLEGCGDEDEETIESRKFPKEFEIPMSKFLLGKIEKGNIIGSGNFGVIYNATLSTGGTDDTIPVAVKVPNSNCSKETFRTFLSEIKVLCYVGTHPHVLEFIGAYTKEIGRGITYIATELCENGALLGYLRKLQVRDLKELPDGCDSAADVVCGNSSGSVDRINDSKRECFEINDPQFLELCRFSHEIALGMDYIASKKIVHGDLSTRNVLLNSELCCKIGDFGLSRKLYEYQEYVKTTSEAMPWRWLAIESLKRMEFTTKSDVWSYGITLWEIFSLGCTPYPGLSWTVGFVEDLENGLRMSAPKLSSNDINEKMSTCWELDPEQRPTFYEMAQFFIALRDQQYIQL